MSKKLSKSRSVKSTYTKLLRKRPDNRHVDLKLFKTIVKQFLYILDDNDLSRSAPKTEAWEKIRFLYNYHTKFQQKTVQQLKYTYISNYCRNYKNCIRVTKAKPKVKTVNKSTQCLNKTPSSSKTHKRALKSNLDHDHLYAIEPQHAVVLPNKQNSRNGNTQLSDTRARMEVFSHNLSWKNIKVPSGRRTLTFSNTPVAQRAAANLLHSQHHQFADAQNVHPGESADRGSENATRPKPPTTQTVSALGASSLSAANNLLHAKSRQFVDTQNVRGGESADDGNRNATRRKPMIVQTATALATNGPSATNNLLHAQSRQFADAQIARDGDLADHGSRNATLPKPPIAQTVTALTTNGPSATNNLLHTQSRQFADTQNVRGGESADDGNRNATRRKPMIVQSATAFATNGPSATNNRFPTQSRQFADAQNVRGGELAHDGNRNATRLKPMIVQTATALATNGPSATNNRFPTQSRQFADAQNVRGGELAHDGNRNATRLKPMIVQTATALATNGPSATNNLLHAQSRQFADAQIARDGDLADHGSRNATLPKPPIAQTVTALTTNGPSATNNLFHTQSRQFADTQNVRGGESADDGNRNATRRKPMIVQSATAFATNGPSATNNRFPTQSRQFADAQNVRGGELAHDGNRNATRLKPMIVQTATALATNGPSATNNLFPTQSRQFADAQNLRSEGLAGHVSGNVTANENPTQLRQFVRVPLNQQFNHVEQNIVSSPNIQRQPLYLIHSDKEAASLFLKMQSEEKTRLRLQVIMQEHNYHLLEHYRVLDHYQRTICALRRSLPEYISANNI